MNSYRISLEQLRQQPEITDMLSALQRGLEKFDIDFYLVGAVARDVWMQGINKIAPRRTTGDIDFAVLINDKGTYEALKEYLTIAEGFQPYKGNSFVLIWKDKTEVDLLPFGTIEDEDGRVMTNGLGLTNINLPGFAEVYEQGLPVINLFPDAEENITHSFKFCTLPGIVLLKMIAWHDRPEKRRDDIKDISDILNHFFAMYDNQIWENHHDLFGDNDSDLKHIAARVMGREMNKIARRNPTLFDRIERILYENTADTPNSKMALIMIEYFENTMEDCVLLLQQLKQGFKE